MVKTRRVKRATKKYSKKRHSIRRNKRRSKTLRGGVRWWSRTSTIKNKFEGVPSSTKRNKKRIEKFRQLKEKYGDNWSEILELEKDILELEKEFNLNNIKIDIKTDNMKPPDYNTTSYAYWVHDNDTGVFDIYNKEIKELQERNKDILKEIENILKEIETLKQGYISDE